MDKEQREALKFKVIYDSSTKTTEELYNRLDEIKTLRSHIIQEAQELDVESRYVWNVIHEREVIGWRNIAEPDQTKNQLEA